MPDFGSQILDVAIGVVFVYLLLALISTSIVETFATLARKRSKTLHAGLQRLVDGEGAADPNLQALLDHPLMASLGERPSYIPARRFADAVIAVSAVDYDRETGAITANLPDNYLGKQLSALIKGGGDNIESFRSRLMNWFDDGMDRVSGEYKRWSQVVLGVVAAAVVIVLNADTLKLVQALETDPALRARVVAAASARANIDADGAQQGAVSGDAGVPDVDVTAVRDDIAQLGLPIRGWMRARDGIDDPRELPTSAAQWAWKVVGLTLTAFAVFLGAPFWFDTLKRLVNVRGSGPDPKPTVPQAPASRSGGAA